MLCKYYLPQRLHNMAFHGKELLPNKGKQNLNIRSHTRHRENFE